MKIVILEPFYSGSHRSWAEGLKENSQHEITILSLPGNHWKWRMQGGAISLANQYLQLSESPDLILATDMLDLSTFLALTRSSTQGVKVAIYFHENQLRGAISATNDDVDKERESQFGFINWTSILSADKVFFNSEYNKTSFYKALETLLKKMPDHSEIQLIDMALSNSTILPLGINLAEFSFDLGAKDYSHPVILWNQKWAYDKNPDDFVIALKHLKNHDVDFKLIVCGEEHSDQPTIFETIKTEFENELIHYGFVESKDKYLALLKQANLIPVTSNQEFFGQSAIEAIAAGCFPFLPNAFAYPEHIPDALKSIVLYDSHDQLLTNLTDMCSNLSLAKELVAPIQEAIAKYDWKNIISTYDQQLEAMISSDL